MEYTYDSSRYRVCTKDNVCKIEYYYLEMFVEMGVIKEWIDLHYYDFRGVGKTGNYHDVVTFATRFEAERALLRYAYGDSDIIRD